MNPGLIAMNMFSTQFRSLALQPHLFRDIATVKRWSFSSPEDTDSLYAHVIFESYTDRKSLNSSGTSDGRGYSLKQVATQRPEHPSVNN